MLVARRSLAAFFQSLPCVQAAVSQGVRQPGGDDASPLLAFLSDYDCTAAAAAAADPLAQLAHRVPGLAAQLHGATVWHANARLLRGALCSF